MSSRTSTCRSSRRSATCRRRSTPAPGDPRALPGDRPALRALRRRPVPDRGHRHAVGRGGRPLAGGDEPWRRAAGPLRVHGQRATAPSEAPGDRGHRELQGPLVPHQPLGLRLHRRRFRGQPQRPARQACRDHRYGRHGGAVRAPRRCRGRPALRVPAHAVIDRRPQQPSHRSRVGGEPGTGLAEAADGELQHARVRRSSSRRTSSTTAGPTSSASCWCACATPTSPT